MRAWQKFIALCSVCGLLAVPITLGILGNSAGATVEAEKQEQQAIDCIANGGRTLEIDGVKTCLALTPVPKDLTSQSFWEEEKVECERISNAIYVWENRLKGCFYFEVLEIE